MKPAAEIARELWRDLSQPCTAQDFTLPGPIQAIAAAIAQARREGAEAMRERAARAFEAAFENDEDVAAIDVIRALLVEESEVEK